jgi:hypothetical protein
MDEPQRIVMPGALVAGIAAESPAGPIYMTSTARNPGSHLVQTTLSAVDLLGKVLWRRIFDGHTGVPRAVAGGGVWLAYHGPHGASLEQTGPDGSAVRTIPVAHRPDEKLGEVVILPGGFCTAWTSGPPYRGARVDRRDAEGNCVWSAAIAPQQVAHDCVMEASAETGWRSQPKSPWIPRTFRLHHWQPILVSGDRIMASYREGKSGLGISYFLDAACGEIISSTKPAPIGYKAIAGGGEFLIGVQGYGEFATVRHTRLGAGAMRWETHGAMLIDRAGKLLAVECDNRVAARPRIHVMGGDGSLSGGPEMAGYGMAHPALDCRGNAVLWRDGRLLAVDAELAVRELHSAKDEAAVASRVLLLEGGIVALALDGALVIFRTGLAELENSIWPCADGNLNGNPVVLPS